MTHIDFDKGMSIGMKIWKNARKVERGLGIPNDTVSQWWRRWSRGKSGGATKRIPSTQANSGSD